jgi:hypothetical protein
MQKRLRYVASLLALGWCVGAGAASEEQGRVSGQARYGELFELILEGARQEAVFRGVIEDYLATTPADLEAFAKENPAVFSGFSAQDFRGARMPALQVVDEEWFSFSAEGHRLDIRWNFFGNQWVFRDGTTLPVDESLKLATLLEAMDRNVVRKTSSLWNLILPTSAFAGAKGRASSGAPPAETKSFRPVRGAQIAGATVGLLSIPGLAVARWVMRSTIFRGKSCDRKIHEMVETTERQLAKCEKGEIDEVETGVIRGMANQFLAFKADQSLLGYGGLGTRLRTKRRVKRELNQRFQEGRLDCAECNLSGAAPTITASAKEACLEVVKDSDGILGCKDKHFDANRDLIDRFCVDAHKLSACLSKASR